ncbi:hypothetical protein [Streptomyces sp. NRRL F-2305]|uniref:hypothetical protein n=1 Tax=Streptomyces sp. NRRL F-2305 TaxID=1463840 RepID=UPI001F3B2D02|nr:hypothetical protein [Streptomyces sp. NRRL F-2305]
MTRMTVTNTYMAAVAVAVALAGAPGVAQAVTPAQAPGVAHAHHRISEPASSTAGAVRVVAPGERVRAGAGVELWLTEEGKHWSTGAVTASVVRLPGAPGWGVWYADVPLHEDLTVDGVTLYDKRGKEIASLTPSRP